MGFLSKVKKGAKKLKERAQDSAANATKNALTPVKAIGGTTARALGSKNSFDDFDRGLDRIFHGEVSRKEWNQSLEKTGDFLRDSPKNLVGNVTKQAGDVLHTATEGVTDAVAAGLDGIFDSLFGGLAEKGKRAGKIALIAIGVGAAVVVTVVAVGATREVKRRDVHIGPARIAHR